MRRTFAAALLLAALLLPVRGQDDWLLMRMNAFAGEYNDFAGKLREGQFDLRQAKKLSKLWRELERSGNWPEVNHK